jgi:site-specific recombinase XerD
MATTDTGALSPETVAAYARDWQRFTAWCTAAGVCALPAAPEHVAAFLQSEARGEGQAKGRALASVKRAAVTVGVAHKGAGLANPMQSEAVRLTLRGLAKSKGTQQRQAAGFNQRDADRLGHVLEGSDKPKDVRDLALLLTGRDLLARASEAIAVTAESITWDEADGTAQVMLRRTKTSAEALPFQLGPDAAAALRRWLELSGITQGPVFQGLTRGGKLTGQALKRQDVGRIIKARAGEDFSAHSLRVGMAQDMVSDDIASAAVLQAGGWKSEAMLVRYTRKIAAKKGAVSRYYAKHK